METSEAKLILFQTQAEDPPINTTQSQPGSQVELVVPITIGLTATCAIALFLSKRVLKKGGGSSFLLHPPKIPCQNCHFFSKNSLLKCAVHPTTAMTTDAIGCSDFCAHRKQS